MVKAMVGGCCVCSDERGWDENPLVYCDGHGCNVAVHQGILLQSNFQKNLLLYLLYLLLYTYSLLWYCSSS